MAGDEEIRDPVAEVVEADGGSRLIVELPGVSQDSIKMGVSHDILKLDAEGKRGKFSTVQVIPFEPDPERISVTYSQGVLEVDLRKKEPAKEEEGGPEEELSISLGSLEKELEALKQELGRVTEEKSSIEDRFNLLKRDLSNIRRRHEIEKEAIADRKISDIAAGLVEVLDSFSYAKNNIKDSSKGSKNQSSMLKGVEMVENQVLNLFKSVGINIIPAEGQAFDPNLHEALGYVENPDMEDDVVAREIKRGYLFKGKALRPAQVQVNRKPEKKGSSKKKDRKTDEHKK